MDTVARLLLADDHPMMCEGLRAILEPANQVVGVVHDGREVPSAVTRLDATQRKDVEVVFVTTDPARDTGPALRTYLDHLDPDFVGVTGDLGRIIELAKPLKVFIEKGERLPSGGYDVTHTTEVFGVTGDQARIAWGQDTSPADLSADIIKLLKS